MTYVPYITRAFTLVLGLGLSHAAWAQSDSAPITEDEIANAVAQYETLLATEQALEDTPTDVLFDSPPAEDILPADNICLLYTSPSPRDRG